MRIELDYQGDVIPRDVPRSENFVLQRSLKICAFKVPTRILCISNLGTEALSEKGLLD